MSMSDIQAFMNGEWVSVTSSNHAAAMYDPEGQTLFIRFKSGQETQYLGVPPEIAEGYAVADSHGTYHWDHIRVRGSKTEHQYPYI